jgi:hypothetical protein
MKYSMKKPKQYAPSSGPMAAYQSKLTINYGNGKSMTYEQKLAFPMQGSMPYASQLSGRYQKQSFAYNGKGLEAITGYDKAVSGILSYVAQMNKDAIKHGMPYDKKQKKYEQHCVVCGMPVEEGNVCVKCLNKTVEVGNNGKNYRN